MTATNHVLTGALIASALPHPVVALPLAIASHLVLDALPHYGNSKLPHNSRKFLVILSNDALMSLTILILILITQPAHWLLMISCAIIAASPDLLWLPYWLAELRHRTKTMGPISCFLTVIQQFQFPEGWLIEFSWSIAGLTLLLSVLRG